MSLRFSTLLCSVVLVLAGCATTAPQESPEERYKREFAEAITQAETLLTTDERVAAAAVMQNFVTAHPESSQGWMRLSRLYFDAGQYGSAAVAAEHVLGSDDQDKSLAHSVRAVSGLRIAADSLSALRDDEKLTGSARADAVNLARVLRETLGEAVLVPPRAEPAKRPARTQRAPATPAKPAAPAPATKGGDPFGVLR